MLVSALLTALCAARAVNALAQEPTIAFHSGKDSVRLGGKGTPGVILLDGDDWPGVIRAAGDLAADFGRVTGTNLTRHLLNGTTSNSYRAKTAIIAGTIGHSELLDSLINSGKIDVNSTEGKWEAFQTELVKNPIDGVANALVIAGSDKRGAIYGLYDISEQIGVSPWYWFADSAPAQHPQIYALKKKKTQGSPSVKYRGIFINDEQPAITNWINANYPEGKYGPGFNADFHSHVFELLLRLRANYLWPASWNNIFHLDDPRNSPSADEYGIVMGTSHTEPMMRWTKEQHLLLNGDWNWDTNRENVTAFFKEGAERTKDFESLYTLGMRGLGDVASPTITAKSLGDIVNTQQQVLSDVFNVSDVSSIPQMWCLYKEVGGYFQDGLRVPDDITLLWADDNWGNIQRLPVDNETGREAGAGVYYHFDYVGDPRDYKWINTISLQKTWEQMHLAYKRDARQIWIVNMGDLKGLELPLSHFMDLAYDTPRWSSPDSTSEWLTLWAAREFGSPIAKKTGDIMNRYGMYAARRKYELLSPQTFSLINYNEADNVLQEWEELVKDAQQVYDSLRPVARPAFFEMVLHPCMAGYVVTDIHITAGKNNLYAGQRRTSANALAQKALKLFKEDHELTQRYHNLLDGKWMHIMDQTHLGYDYWQQPMRNTLPPLAYTQLLEESLAGNMGVSVEGSNASVPGDDRWHSLSSNTLTLPPIDPYGPNRWIEVYSRGTEGFQLTVSPHDSWVKATPSSGMISPSGANTDIRVQLSVDWDKAPAGSSMALINVTVASDDYGNFDMPIVQLPVNKTSAPASFRGFVESDGTVSIEAEHTSRNTSAGNTSYAVVPGYGRTLSGVTLLPALAETQQPPSSPRLEYDMYIFSNVTTAKATVYLGPSLNTNPSRPLKYAIAFNDAEPEIVQFVPSTPLGTLPSNWGQTVSNAVWTNTTRHEISGGGSKNTVKLWAVEPGVVFQKVVVDLGGVRESYLGPPESQIV
ncbi:glycoside hydrolase family 115 protein [Aspergillus melleus]|uniref:glycoside hydrolase family 115 protein n=1 Tax=Aspergillus melleus TaxID=138277 RepID=UPI001E8D7706|nr:ATP synthase mitochondrial F1 complex assembly factor 1 [Aspergillus melleus]KAH8425022.1 ATP synthase mitochondrial F1 complex assembly factor 1 [Aspergillus melleus]